LEGLLSRLHVLVVGPGLGREPYMQAFAKMAVGIAKEKAMFLVLDADALLLVGQDKALVKGYRRAILTPNVVEFKRLTEQVVSVVPPVQMMTLYVIHGVRFRESTRRCHRIRVPWKSRVRLGE
jgi:NAD(P)H-hydrate repair Nnr-like enzyme with NAD(P)H-hydrate dehydratase domain